MPDPQILQGHSFPSAEGFSIKGKSIDEYLYDISPTIKIVAIDTHAISRNTFNSIINALSESVDASTTKDFNAETNDEYLKSITDNLDIKSEYKTSLPKSINLFFNTIINNAEREIDLVITSSPQIKIDLTKGWKANQSIFNFLKETLGNDPFRLLFGESGKSVSNIFSSTATLAQNVMNMTGRDIQLGPYWSFSNNPLSNYPEFSMETVLINDCEEHWKINKQIVELLTMDYLPTTEKNSNFKLKPPYLFNIEIGVDFGFIKKMYLCKATFIVTETGRYFLINGEKIPEFFKVTCHFTSLLPDIQNLSDPSFKYKGTGKENYGANVSLKEKPTEDDNEKNDREAEKKHIEETVVKPAIEAQDAVIEVTPSTPGQTTPVAVPTMIGSPYNDGIGPLSTLKYANWVM